MSIELSWLTIIFNSFSWPVTNLPSTICRLSNLHIKYTLFKVDVLSYIFDNVFNRFNVVFSLMILKVMFLDSINRINPRICGSLNFHCFVVMVSGFAPTEVREDFFDTTNLQFKIEIDESHKSWWISPISYTTRLKWTQITGQRKCKEHIDWSQHYIVLLYIYNRSL